MSTTTAGAPDRTLVNIWASDASARLGFQVIEFLLPVVALTVVGVSATSVGLVTALEFLPVLLFSLTAGTVAASYRSGQVLLVANVVRLTAVAGLTLLAFLHRLNLGVLLVAALVVGVATVLYDIAFQAAVPRLIGTGGLLKANSALQASVATVQMAGPALAGVLAEAFGAPLALAVTALVFVAATLGFLTVRSTDATIPTRTKAPSILEGLRFTWGNSAIRSLCMQSGWFNLHEQAFLTVFLIYGLHQAGLHGAGVGADLGAASAGTIIGAAVSARLSRRLHFGWTLTTALTVSGIALLLAALASSYCPIAVFAAGFALNGAAQGIFNVNAVSLRQVLPPAEYLAPVTASYRMVSFGTIPLGAVLGGLLATRLSPRLALVLIAGSLILGSVQMAAGPIKRIQRLADLSLIRSGTSAP